MDALLTGLVGRRLSKLWYDVESDGWYFTFDEAGSLRVDCRWRIVASGRVALADLDHGELVGRESVIDAQQEWSASIDGVVSSVDVLLPSGDLVITFANGARLEAQVSSSHYENWCLSHERRWIVAAPGGRINVGEFAPGENSSRGAIPAWAEPAPRPAPALAMRDLDPLFAALVGRELARIGREAESGEWLFDFGASVLNAWGPWRIVVELGVPMTDYGPIQSEVLRPEGAQEWRRWIEGRVTGIELGTPIGDLALTFANGARLELWVASCGYDSWRLDCGERWIRVTDGGLVVTDESDAE